MKLKWEIILDCNDEDDNPTCWAAEINHEKYGIYVWITLNYKGKYDVEIKRDDDFKVLVTCNSLISAKRWVSTYLK